MKHRWAMFGRKFDADIGKGTRIEAAQFRLFYLPLAAALVAGDPGSDKRNGCFLKVFE